ncbi:hypothetical protein FSP39_013110 [Pinctada imbricata]|uniref:Uncharacterized protein n=1 Tax=Pinctada imbricata TaxID=66713 RepID=A0AA89BMB1_PINIB|nr:hypothetical protein FSP39_013110 [Pinctada imbricata]
MDGVPMVTQYPINPGETFTYRFKADPRGTHWYHSHFGVTRSDGLYGAIVVLPRQILDKMSKNHDINFINRLYKHRQESADAVGLNQKCLDVSDMKASDDDIQIRQLPIPSEGDDIKEIFLNFHFSKDLPYPPSVNGREFTKPAFPFLLRPYEMGTSANLCDKLSCIRECRCQHVVKVKKGQIVQLILNNSDDQKKGMVHPIHLHGQSFHVLKTAYPSYDSTFGTVSEINPDIHFTNFYTTQRWNNTAWQGNSIPGLNLVNPPRKDVMTIPRKGYVIIRFRADNPGFWFMHCHKETHVQLGMALVLQVGDPEDLPPLPQDFPVCSPPQPYKIPDTGKKAQGVGLLQNNLATNMKVTNLAEQVSEDTSENTEKHFIKNSDNYISYFHSCFNSSGICAVCAIVGRFELEVKIQ